MAGNTIKQSIKASALELFCNKGFEATGIRELSAKANCSLPMMYYYYENKERLLREIVAEDFIAVMNDIFNKAIKTNNLRQFTLSFANDILALSGANKMTVQTALRLHMGAPKHDELNKVILQFKYAKENQLKNLMINTWLGEKNMEQKIQLALGVLYNFIVAALLTNRPVSVKQLDAEIIYLMQG